MFPCQKVAFACVLVLLIIPITQRYKERSYPRILRLFDWGLIIACIFSLANLSYSYKTLASRGGAATETDLVLGALLILLLLECTRRLMGWALPIITVVALCYAMFGDRIPGLWGHFPLDLEQIISYQFLTTEGLFGIPLGVSASFIFVVDRQRWPW